MLGVQDKNVFKYNVNRAGFFPRSADPELLLEAIHRWTSNRSRLETLSSERYRLTNERPR